ncbi:hypothetical protein HN903_04635 [archaeon]|jgi:hypothetical protein|nr:hypothetical protein [archaeon]MBT7129015.1 hypothetical protein [archaeon]
MVTTITDVLNIWNEIGVFSYVIPFLLIFAVVFAILKKTGILGDGNDGILAVIAVAVGLLSLQFDFVSEFFAIIFPRFGIGLSLFLVLLIFLGFFSKDGSEKENKLLLTFAGVIGVGTLIWSFGAWEEWSNYGGFGGWFSENFWALLVLGGVIAVIVIVAKGKAKVAGTTTG